MRRKETIYLEKDVADYLEKLAKENKMTFSSCCSTIICDTITQMREDQFSSSEETREFSNEKVHVELRSEDAALLKRKASELHLTPTEWVRNVVRRKNLTIYHVRLDDLEELLNVFDRHVTVIEHIFVACKEIGKVSKLDLELIAERQEEIKELVLSQLSQTFNKREKRQAELIKKYYEKM